MIKLSKYFKLFFILFVLCLLSQSLYSDSACMMSQEEINDLKKNLAIALEEVNLLRMDLAFVSGNQEISSKLSESFKQKIKDLQRNNTEAEKRLNDYIISSEKKIEKMTESEKKTNNELLKLRDDVRKLNEELKTVKKLLRDKERNRILENISYAVVGACVAIGLKALWDFLTGGSKQ